MTLTKLVMLVTIATLSTTAAVPRAHAGDNPEVVKITANKFHFTPDHITLVKGQPVTLQLSSTDVTHGFMIRALKIDTDIKPGKTTEMTVTPTTAGTFKAICDHYCGLGHSGMKMTVVVQERTAQAPSEKLMSANTAAK